MARLSLAPVTILRYATAMMLLPLLLLQLSPTAPFLPKVKPAVAWNVPYDQANPFARILRGELPVAKVYEDRDLLAFMDNAPRSRGHVLIIARRSTARNALEMKPALFAKMMKLARRIGQAERDGLGADGFVIQQNNGVMQSVPHLHIHIVPAFIGVPIAPPETSQVPLADLQATAALLRAALPR